MPRPMAICLEDLDAPHDDERYLRCVACPGGEPGLGLDGEGIVRWMPDGPAAYELWVSADGRLALERSHQAPAITVRRGGRSVRAPAGSPVILLDQDLLEVSGRRLCVHVHGEAEELHEPTWLSGRSLARMARAAAVALALGTAVGAAGPVSGSPAEAGVQPDPIDVRRRPPKPAPRYSYCDIVKLYKHKQQGQMLELHCIRGRVSVGMMGVLLDAKGGYLNGGSVTIKTVKGDKVTATTKLKKLGKAAKVRFSR